MSIKNTFEIICSDALKWLKSQKDGSLDNIVTGIPDMDEVKKSPEKYQEFFYQATELIFQKLHPKSYAIFMVTDRKFQKKWIDKSFLIQLIAMRMGIPLRWHKIVLLRPVGSTHIQRPTYQHYLCFSLESGPGEATPDVMMCGHKSYSNASCPEATAHAIHFLSLYSKNKRIIDPFVGRGTTLIEAKKTGKFSGLGIDLDPKQCRMARKGLATTSPSKRSKTSTTTKSKRKQRKRSRK